MIIQGLIGKYVFISAGFEATITFNCSNKTSSHLSCYRCINHNKWTILIYTLLKKGNIIKKGNKSTNPGERRIFLKNKKCIEAAATTNDEPTDNQHPNSTAPLSSTQHFSIIQILINSFIISLMFGPETVLRWFNSCCFQGVVSKRPNQSYTVNSGLISSSQASDS